MSPFVSSFWEHMADCERLLSLDFGSSGGRGDSGTLRSAKSEESLTSLHAVDGKMEIQLFSESGVIKPRQHGHLCETMNILGT